MFEQFLIDDLGVENGQHFSIFEETANEEAIKVASNKAWDQLVGHLNKIKLQKRHVREPVFWLYFRNFKSDFLACLLTIDSSASPILQTLNGRVVIMQLWPNSGIW